MIPPTTSQASGRGVVLVLVSGVRPKDSAPELTVEEPLAQIEGGWPPGVVYIFGLDDAAELSNDLVNMRFHRRDARDGEVFPDRSLQPCVLVRILFAECIMDHLGANLGTGPLV